MKVSLKDIARRAHVSPAMVSQVLNGKGRASENVRTKIIKLLEENGYRPKYARRPFYYIIDLPRIEAAGKTQNALEQLSGIEHVFEEKNLSLHVEFIRAQPTMEQLKTIIERKPSGVFLNTDAPFLQNACLLFQRAKIPLVQIGYDTENPDYSAVVLDSFSGTHAATRYLIDKGHKRIALIRWTAGLSVINSNKKYAGYQAAFADAGLSVPSELVKSLSSIQSNPLWIPARYLVRELLTLPQPPTAAIIDNSFISLSLLYPLPGEKSLPQDLAHLEMLHFEDWSLRPVHDILSGKLFYPPLQTTVVSIDWELIGKHAAQLLIERVENFSLVPHIIRICPALYLIDGDNRTLILSGGIA